MVIINEVSAKAIKDSRGEKTISVTIKTDVGRFEASSPNGKSTGKYEAKSYKKDIEGDIRAVNDFKEYFSEEILEKFEDLRRVEDICEGHVGANTLFALESAVLKAIAKEQKKEVWELINPRAKKFPRLVGNCVGGGKHSEKSGGKKPDFQEFLLIPNKNVKQSFELNKDLREKAGDELDKIDDEFNNKPSDEKGWMVSLNEKEIFEVLKKFKVGLGTDVAASSFYKRKKYHYENPRLDRTVEEQMFYLSNLIKNFGLEYIEDPFEENDFESFAKLLHRSVYTQRAREPLRGPKLRSKGAKKFPKPLIVGDDLVVTNYDRLKKAIEKKAVNAVIVKPNQCGSLLNVRRVCDLAKENNIKIVFSHRSGETAEDILADLCFGFGGDFFKCGIVGREREVKLRRLVEIEKSVK